MALCVFRKPCGNGEDFTQDPTVPMHKVTKFSPIRTSFVLIHHISLNTSKRADTNIVQSSYQF